LFLEYPLAARLARHYGYTAQLKGPTHAAVRAWLTEGETFRIDGG
jgi:hypothetical protein